MLRKNRKPVEQPTGSSEFFPAKIVPPQLTTAVQHLKDRISSPFDFQHLTHTNRHHFAALQEASENDLVAGFRAVRASQTPQRDLTGIKADDLHSDSASEESTPPARRSISAMELRPSPDFVDRVIGVEESPQPSENPVRPSLRQTRSVESFSRPGVNPHHRHTQSANPPPRMSSRLPAPDSPEATRVNRQSGTWDNVAPLSPSRMGTMLPSMAEEPDYVGHALTTPDNSAIHPMSPFSPGLEDVAEEPERFVSPRPAPLPPNRSPGSPRSPSYTSMSFGQRSPVGRSHARRDSHVLPKQLNLQSMTRPGSAMSEALPSPALSRRPSIRKPIGARKSSNTWRVIEESWEDDIDYIYNNALEAECGSDWDGASGEETLESYGQPSGQRVRSQVSAPSAKSSAVSSPVAEISAAGPGLFAGNFRSSLLVPSPNQVPDLEPRSAISSSTMDTRVHTPSEYFSSPGFPYTASEADRFSFAPSLMGSPDFKEHAHREEMYDQVLADYEGSDKHFALLEPTRSIASSTRSSHALASKHSSYESSVLSSGHGSGLWTASGARRSGSSAGSLPELVHSARSTRQDMPPVIDKLAEQTGDDLANLSQVSQERSFFTSEDDQEAISVASATLNMEMKTSLELARQGSNGSSTRARTNHKYASSEGAAKLLAPKKSLADVRTANSRNRAGSVPQKNRGQYLSLFPTPPKRSPVSPLSPAAN